MAPRRNAGSTGPDLRCYGPGSVRGPTRTLVSVLAMCALAVPATALAEHRPGPCHLHELEDETMRQFSKRLIRCAANRWEVPGGADKAICIADAESGLNPDSRSARGAYLGLFQHSAEAWPDRYAEWTRPAWELDESALSGRTNAIVTMRMVNAGRLGRLVRCRRLLRPAHRARR